MEDKIKEAFDIIKQAMIEDEPEKPGSYAHTWHCNIAMACYDAIVSAQSKIINYYPTVQDVIDPHKVANDAASRFMKLCFDVKTKG